MKTQPTIYIYILTDVVRHGYPYVPTEQAQGRPRQVALPTRRLTDLLVGPTDLVGIPHDLLKTF
jgi:hypothetical protein